jgi:carboxylesterase type B
MKVSPLLQLALLIRGAQCTLSVVDQQHSVTYNGLERNGIEVFLNIPFGRDTSGSNRFKPPRPFVPEPGSTINAQSLGHSCPQQTGEVLGLLALANITDISEDCLNLNIGRPKGCSCDSRLPVMVWIYGGSFWVGTNGEPTTRPGGLVLESIQNKLPVIHVSINYRLGGKRGFPDFCSQFANLGCSQSSGSRNRNL